MRRLFGLFFASMLLAGCAGGAPASTGAVQTTSAPPPAPDDETGALSGVVVDDESMALAKVMVAIVETGGQTETDAAGAFTINDLAPGDYTVAAQRLGYDSAARRVSVRIGEVTNVTLVLTPIDIAAEPYILNMPHTSYIQAGNSWGHFASFLANDTGLHSMMCESCVWHFKFDKKPQALQTEARWQCSPCQPPLVNDDVWYLVTQNNTDGAAGITFINTYLSNQEKFAWTEAMVKTIGYAKKDQAQWRVNAGGGSIGSTGATGVSYNQRINLWQTFAYHQDLPEGFTAFPE